MFQSCEVKTQNPLWLDGKGVHLSNHQSQATEARPTSSVQGNKNRHRTEEPETEPGTQKTDPSHKSDVLLHPINRNSGTTHRRLSTSA
ncbi:hypothetical protein LXL04_004908 [Taraxacum kok-saghyz]